MNPQQPASSPANLLYTDPLHAEAREVLRRLTGIAHAEFHDDQYEAIRALVADRARTLVVQRTGWVSLRSTSFLPCCCVPAVWARLLLSPRCFPSCVIRLRRHPARECAPPW